MCLLDLTVCIVNWNARTDLQQALDSVLAADSALNIQIVVVDNASSDGSAEMVRERFPHITLIESPRNSGFAGGYNRAAREARGRHLLVLNPDTIVMPGALSTLVRYLDDNEAAGAAGPCLLNPDGSLQFSCRRFPRPMAALFRNTPLAKLAPRNRFTREYLMSDWDHETGREVDWLSGAAICIRREAWEQVGGFDEGFFMYAEDIDWCLRAHQRGWRICYVPSARVVHAIGRSSDQRPVHMVIHFHRSMGRFYRKHYAPRWPLPLRWTPVLGIWLRAGIVLSGTLWRLGWAKLNGLWSRGR
jgi:hypothetical protein